MGILLWVVFGLIAGAIARFPMHGAESSPPLEGVTVRCADNTGDVRGVGTGGPSSPSVPEKPMTPLSLSEAPNTPGCHVEAP